MKAQDMPMKTIVFVIIALIVIAVVVIWYMVASGSIEASTFDIFGLGEDKAKLKCDGTYDCPPGYECTDCGGSTGKVCLPLSAPICP